MNIIKEQPAKTTVKLKIELSVEDLQPHLKKAVQRISKEVKIPGFRPGHVTYEVLKHKISEMEIYQEAARVAIDATLPQAVQQEKVNFVGQPNIHVEQVAPGNSFIYSAEFSLMPEVVLNEYKTVKAQKKAVTVDEKKYTQTLEHLRKMQAVSKPVERVAKLHDKVEIDFSITQDNVPIEGGQGKHVPVTLGEKTFIPGFEEQLEGMKAGDTKKFKVTFPKDYGVKHLAGRECDVDATVHTVFEVTLPPLDDALAKALKFEALADLEKAIRENITKELDQKAETEFETTVIEAAIAQATFDPIPQPMITTELDRMMQEMQHDIEQQGAKFDEYLKHVKKTEQELRDTWKDKAEQRVKSALLLKTIGETENITISEEAIDVQAEKYRAMYKDSPELGDRLDSLDFRAYLRTSMRNEEAMKKLKEYAQKE